MNYTFTLPAYGGADKLSELDIEAQFDRVATSAKEITLEVFATDESASVQVGSDA